MRDGGSRTRPPSAEFLERRYETKPYGAATRSGAADRRRGRRGGRVGDGRSPADADVAAAAARGGRRIRSDPAEGGGGDDDTVLECSSQIRPGRSARRAGPRAGPFISPAAAGGLAGGQRPPRPSREVGRMGSLRRGSESREPRGSGPPPLTNRRGGTQRAGGAGAGALHALTSRHDCTNMALLMTQYQINHH